jgi:predicted acyltransferase
MAAVALATCIWLIEVRKVIGWSRPFVAFGANPIVAFVGSEMMARLIYSVIEVPYQGDTVSLQTAIYRGAFASWLPPQAASLAFALVFVLFWYAVLAALLRRNLILKI